MQVALAVSSKPHVIAFSPALVPLTGDHAAATVLCQIMYWHQGRLRVTRKGAYWLAKSRQEMCAETGITLDQYKRIMPLLVQQGWIVQERGLFNNKVTPHIRLTDAGQEAMRQHLMGGKPTIQLVAKPSNPLVSSDANVITETTAKITSSTCEEEHLAIADVQTETKNGEEEKDKEQKEQKEQKTVETEHVVVQEVPVKAADILKAHRKPTGSVQAYWKSRMSLREGTFQKALTLKEAGQLKMLQNSCGERTKPVIDYVLAHWWKFASQAGASSGSPFPADPHIGFLLKHHAVAVNLLTPEVTTSPVMETPVQLIAIGAEPEIVHTVTPQELADLLDGLKTP